MHWFFTFMNSSLGKKIVMAVTGILLCLFLLLHLINNLILFAGPGTFNTLVGRLEAVKPLIRIMEFGMVILFLAHIGNGIRLTIENRRAGSGKYKVNKASENSSWFSRYMGFTGSIIFIFLVIHLSTFWYRFQIVHDHSAYYDIVVYSSLGFGNLAVTALYGVAVTLLGFHLYHGFQSAFQTFGILKNQYIKLIQAVSFIFWFLIPFAFLFITVYFGLLKGGH